MSAPTWTREASVRAVWARTGESAEWIAARLDDLVRRASALTGVQEWRLSDDSAWRGDPTELAALVRRHPAGADPAEGFVLSVAGTGPDEVHLNLLVSAGATHVGSREPAHHLLLSTRPLGEHGLDVAVGDGLCRAVAEAWEPAAVKLTSREVNRTARRGGWLAPVGHRVWLHRDVAPHVTPAASVTAEAVGQGTLLAVPDDWEAPQVVEAVLATYEASGVDTIPH
ncbi:hypothetical protein ACOACO_16950 [Nocardioides sp. CPCC 205120]|uniref:hypothetical protein n=1 Tax=Nocardioides sp. CPCC 205120 TaxID=3406462 RepID=UPI003B503C5D